MKKYLSTTRANYRRTSLKKNVVIALVASFFILLGLFFSQLYSAVAFVVLFPVQSVTNWVQYSEQTLPQYLRNRSDMLAEIESLKKELSTGLGTQLSIKRLRDENNQLLAMLGSGGDNQRLVARVMKQPSPLAYDLLQIDKGTNHGVVLGAPVFLGIDTVVGEVAHVTPLYAFVRLVTSPGFEAMAYIIGPNVFAPMEGVGGGVARVKLPQGVMIETGNVVILPSVASGVYGEITAVENEPTQPEQFGYVVPPVPLYGLSYVSVALTVPPPLSAFEISTNIETAVSSNFTFKQSDVDLSTTTATSSEEIIEVEVAPENL